MKFTKLTITLVAMFSAGKASAFPVQPIQKCDQSSYDESMRDLFIKVNLIGKVEKRRDLSKLKGLEAAGFTKEDIKRANTCGGIVFCPASGTEGPAGATAFSLVSPGQVFIPGHFFFNKDTSGHPTILRSNLDNCYFANPLHPNDHIPLKMGEVQKKRLHNLDVSSTYIRDLREDGLNVKLATAIPGCKPFDVDRSGRPLQAGDEVLSIGAPTPDIKPLPSGRELVGQFCQIRKPILFSNGPSYYFSDCSSSPGESGSIQFERVTVKSHDGRVRYKWVAKAMEVGGGDSNLNGHDFNIAVGSDNESIGIEADHLRDILNESDVPKPPIEHTATSQTIGI